MGGDGTGLDASHATRPGPGLFAARVRARHAGVVPECLGHLPIPVWLNEGLAVNTERRLTRSTAEHSPQQLRAKHLAFWSGREIQAFWSGQSFFQPGDASLLSYDLARIMVEQLSAMDWERFKCFVNNAKNTDAGAAAAQEHLGMDLGAVVCTLLEQEWSPECAPRAY